MSVLEAVRRVLEEEGGPLHYKEITQRVLDQGLWRTKGLTPWDTVNARIAVDIKRDGEQSRFYRAAPGVYGCRGDGHPGPSPEPGPAARMSFLDAAEMVLEEYAGQEPMHYRDITQKALDLHLIETGGLTPEATMYAGILTEIQRQIKRGELPRFEKLGKGYVGLTRWHEQGLPYQIEVHNREVREHLMQRLGAMDPVAFEELVGELLAKIGFEDVVVTRTSGDGGIDVRGTLVTGDVIRTKMAVQVKRWKNNVQAPVVQQVRGSLGAHEQGLIITTSDFSAGARQEAEQPDKIPIALMNGEQMVNLLIEYDIGVVRTSYDLIELQEDGE
jgi:restriction system protein